MGFAHRLLLFFLLFSFTLLYICDIISLTMSIFNRFLFSSLITYITGQAILPPFKQMCDIGPNTRDVILMLLSILSGLITVVVTAITKDWLKQRQMERYWINHSKKESSQRRVDTDFRNPQTSADLNQEFPASNGQS